MENTSLSGFGIILLFIITGILFPMLVLGFSKLVRPSRPNVHKLSTYECGEEATGSAWGNFNFRFYIIALVFLMFEVEVVFLFPWTVIFGDKDLMDASNGSWAWFAFIEMFVFVAALALGLWYVWAKGFLEWNRPEVNVEDYNSPVPSAMYDKINQRYGSDKKTGKGPEIIS